MTGPPFMCKNCVALFARRPKRNECPVCGNSGGGDGKTHRWYRSAMVEL